MDVNEIMKNNPLVADMAAYKEVFWINPDSGKEADIPYLAHTAAYGNGNNGTLGSFIVLKEEDMANIYRLTL